MEGAEVVGEGSELSLEGGKGRRMGRGIREGGEETFFPMYVYDALA